MVSAIRFGGKYLQLCTKCYFLTARSLHFGIMPKVRMIFRLRYMPRRGNGTELQAQYIARMVALDPDVLRIAVVFCGLTFALLQKMMADDNVAALPEQVLDDAADLLIYCATYEPRVLEGQIVILRSILATPARSWPAGPLSLICGQNLGA